MKKVLGFLAAGCLALGVQAGTLYWQLGTGSQSGEDYVAVVAKASDGGTTYLNLLDSDGGAVVGKIVGTESAKANVQYADLTGYETGYSFFVEMLSSTTGHGYTSAEMSYSDLSGYISTGGITSGEVSVWTANVSIPEPTSGLLLLVGGALLALRRRRAA